ncbi:S8 family serine peptidase [Flavobacterium humi]|uniref:T9SS type A sorting domain-containing protein n=1 Tax=Flavobacterium humi TaxID=2562683 RepID=A0A4Z0LAM5_9FLAO|nr:S8 family serine peptidase [Flavobacterium humi]TGD59082.1 T9SS type A sorting domain-containing protein [Flavobacterium humi]
MKRILLFVFGLISISSFSQEDAWIFFNAKPNAQYYYDNPLQMLSQKALDRRTAQNIALDIRDVPLHQPYIDQITASAGITVLAKSKWLNALHIKGTQANINALTVLSFVDHVQYANHSLNPGGRKSVTTGKTKPSNKFLDIQANYDYGTSANQVQMLNAHILHQQNYTGAGKIIAIMDAGFPGVNTTTPFQRLRDNGLILGGYDFVHDSPDPYTGYQHGTQVLSDMGGYVSGQLVGTAPDAHYYLFITEDVSSESPLEESNWVEAAEMADSLGVDVINTSLGYFTYDNPNYSYTYDDMNGTTSFVSRAADIAFTRGMICVTSAGNSGSTVNPHIAVPGDAALNLTVGAVNAAEVKGGFSSIGPSFDGRIKPDLMAMGVAAVVATQTGSIGTNNGTSFASPILAGAITSFWSAFPTKTNAEIVRIIKESADRFTAPNNNYGYGIPDFQLALNRALSAPSFTQEKFNVYPNPASDFVTVTCPGESLGSEIVVYNSIGQIIFRQNLNAFIQYIPVKNWSSGIYHYAIASAGKKQNGKIIKN